MEPAPKTTTTTSRSVTTPRGVSKERSGGEQNENGQPRSVMSKSAGVGGGPVPGARERRPPTAVFNGVRRSFRKGGVGGRAGGARGAGGSGRYVGTGGKGEGKTLAELVMFDEIQMEVMDFVERDVKGNYSAVFACLRLGLRDRRGGEVSLGGGCYYVVI